MPVAVALEMVPAYHVWRPWNWASIRSPGWKLTSSAGGGEMRSVSMSCMRKRSAAAKRRSATVAMFTTPVAREVLPLTVRQDQLLGVRHERVFRLAAAEVAERQVVQARVHHSRRLERRRQIRKGRADHARVGHEGEDAARLAREAVEDLVVQGVAEAERVDRDVADVLL